MKNDSWLEPYNDAIQGRHDHVLWKLNQLTQDGKISLSDFADGHLYFGLHRTARRWIFREWAPNATKIFSWRLQWLEESEEFELKPVGTFGNWEIKLPLSAMKHGDLYKMKVYWDGGSGERIPAWCQRVVQDDTTKIFSAQVWDPAEKYVFKKKNLPPKAKSSPYL